MGSTTTDATSNPAREEEIRELRKGLRHLFVLLVILFLICAFGGFLFKWAEGRKELEYKCGVKKVRRDFIDSLWQASRFMNEDDWKSLGRRRLLKFEDELHTAFDAGINSYSGIKAWSFINSVFYAMTVITTIGYGHISPSTSLGQLLTIVYALVGIPIFTITMCHAGKVLTRAVKLLLPKIKFIKSRYSSGDEFDLPLLTTLAVLICYCMAGALFFCLWETDWGLLGSLYFVFISSSTIGFGDLVPTSPLIAILSSVYFLFGLALTSLCLGKIQERLDGKVESLVRYVGPLMGINVTGADQPSESSPTRAPDSETKSKSD